MNKLVNNVSNNSNNVSNTAKSERHENKDTRADKNSYRPHRTPVRYILVEKTHENLKQDSLA